MMRWIGVGLVVFGVMFVALPVGIHSQAWSRWWFAGSTLSAPGVVPINAPPQGPLLSDTSALMAAIQPWLVRPTPYLFGGCALTGVDCSCFVQLVLRSLGVSVPRTAQAQYDAVQLVNSNDLQVGDLLFYQRTYASPDRITHVAFYVGGGMQISAIEPTVGRQALGSPFWVAHYAGAGRVRR
jgi:cell wall-associated NlpC family hydrolase